MFTLLEPSETKIADYFAEQKDLPFSYEEVGASKNIIPSGYPINHHRRQLGSGADAFTRAKKAIDNWTMYQLGWTRVYPAKVPVAAGESVCIVVNHGFCWSLNPCRIIYVLEENTDEMMRYGFAFGTLPGHSEAGEERFTVERHRADNSVWYELISFARPQHILTRIGAPFVTLFQRKFVADSARAMMQAVTKN